VTPLTIALVLIGAVWGFASDRIAVRWPEHDEGEGGRAAGWRTIVAVLTGATALGAVTLVYEGAPERLVFSAYLAALVLLLAIDLDQRLLPDELTLPAIPIALIFAFVGANPLVSPGGMPISIVVAIAVPLVLFALSIPFGAGAFGLGDVKLLVSMGLLAGPWRLIGGVMYGVLSAGIVIVVLLVLRRITLKTYVPFGPFLVFGAMWALLTVQ
jgi:leader peptidase (prepilin peptidase) / N-methyltransferase